MSQPYSKRFTDGGPVSAAGAAGSVTVPAGKVWVVKCCLSYNTGTAGLAFWRLHGIPVLIQRSTASDQTYEFNELTAVLFAGEVLELLISSGSWFWAASGYELDAP